MAGIWERIKRAVLRPSVVDRGTEEDVATDDKQALRRAGDEPFVGRVAGDDPGFAGKTGAEARREHDERTRRSDGDEEDTGGGETAR